MSEAHVPIGAPLLALLAADRGLLRATRPVIGIAGESGSGKTVAATAPRSRSRCRWLVRGGRTK